MTASTSRVVSSRSKSGFSAPGVPTSASTAVPPLAALGTVAMGWQAASSIAASTRIAAAALRIRRLVMRVRHPDVGNRGDQKGDHDDPGRPVDLTLQAPAGAIAAAQAVAAAADR